MATGKDYSEDDIKLKILQVIHVFHPAQMFGGPQRVVYDLSKELVRRGHEVSVYTTNALDRTRNFSFTKSEYEFGGFRVRYFKNILRPDKLYISPGLVSVVGNIRRFDLIHIHSWRNLQDMVISIFAREFKIPYILQVHGGLPRSMGNCRLKLIYDILLGYRELNAASRVIALSQIEAQQYRGMGVPEEKIEIIPNGIDLSDYTDLPPKGRFKKKFDIDDDEKVVLYLGRIHRIKGIDILVKAFARLIEKLDDVKLGVVGPDDGYLSQLEALIKALKIQDKVFISEHLFGKDKLEAYVDADVYVLPSRYEIFGITPIEAIACGTPVILTENCGIAEYFKDKVGMVVKPYTDHLFKALLEMLLDEERQRAFRKNCKAVVEEFSISKIVSKLQKIYEEMANGG